MRNDDQLAEAMLKSWMRRLGEDGPTYGPGMAGRGAQLPKPKMPKVGVASPPAPKPMLKKPAMPGPSAAPAVQPFTQPKIQPVKPTMGAAPSAQPNPGKLLKPRKPSSFMTKPTKMGGSGAV